jgi:hypothetical protein
VWGWAAFIDVGGPFGWWINDETFSDWGAAIVALESTVKEFSQQSLTKNLEQWQTTILIAGRIANESLNVWCDQLDSLQLPNT